MALILVVDDEVSLLNDIAEIMELQNYQVITARCGQTGIDMALSYKPDLIISDIRMQPVDGYTLLGVVRERLPDLPIILMSALPQVDTENATAYLRKPFDIPALLSLVSRYL